MKYLFIFLWVDLKYQNKNLQKSTKFILSYLKTIEKILNYLFDSIYLMIFFISPTFSSSSKPYCCGAAPLKMLSLVSSIVDRKFTPIFHFSIPMWHEYITQSFSFFCLLLVSQVSGDYKQS